MALIAKTIYYLTIAVFFFGQLARITLFGLNFPIIDLCLFALVIPSLIYTYHHRRKINNQPWLIFLIFSWFSFFLNLILFDHSLLKPLFYQIRLNLLILLFILPKPKINIRNFLVLILTANIIFGLIQYLFWPDFTFFNSLGWDPHLYRLVGTFFDPTFTGLIYLLFLIYLYFQPLKNFFLNNFLLIIIYVSMALTYSRSTYLAFIITFSYISYIKKSIKLLIFSIILLTATILILPRNPGEGTKLERVSSIRAKIENYQQGLILFNQFPFIGTGYNFLPSIRTDVNPSSHSIGGFDSSLLTILITNGILGFIPFIFGLVHFFKKNDLLKRIFILAIIIHSLFANSLLYPWTLIFLFFI